MIYWYPLGLFMTINHLTGGQGVAGSNPAVPTKIHI